MEYQCENKTSEFEQICGIKNGGIHSKQEKHIIAELKNGINYKSDKKALKANNV